MKIITQNNKTHRKLDQLLTIWKAGSRFNHMQLVLLLYTQKSFFR